MTLTREADYWQRLLRKDDKIDLLEQRVADLEAQSDITACALALLDKLETDDVELESLSREMAALLTAAAQYKYKEEKKKND